MIPIDRYTSDAALTDEIARLFARGWQFVGMTDELASNRDFICVDLPGHAIVVQNFKGELRAFRNVCTHRLSRIQWEDRGNRHLMCRYHGWTFDADGMPRGVRERLDPADLADDPGALCLKRYRVEACGRFVFVSLDGDAPPLSDHLGAFAPVLEEIGRHMGAETGFAVVPHQANWKLLVENVLECYHCAAVHPETFVKGLGVGRRPIDDVRFDARHSSSHFPRTPTPREGLRKKLMAHLDARGFAHDSFFHIHIFPNLFISSTEGTAFYVGHALPRDARTTMLRTRFFEAKVELSPSQRRRQDIINEQGATVGRQVIEEDRLILENVQLGMEAADTPGVLAREEVRIRYFMDAYRQAMAGDTAAPAPPVSPRPAEAV